MSIDLMLLIVVLSGLMVIHPLEIVFPRSTAIKNVSMCRGFANPTCVCCGSRPPESPASCRLSSHCAHLAATCSGNSTASSKFTT